MRQGKPSIFRKRAAWELNEEGNFAESLFLPNSPYPFKRSRRQSSTARAPPQVALELGAKQFSDNSQVGSTATEAVTPAFAVHEQGSGACSSRGNCLVRNTFMHTRTSLPTAASIRLLPGKRHASAVLWVRFILFKEGPRAQQLHLQSCLLYRHVFRTTASADFAQGMLGSTLLCSEANMCKCPPYACTNGSLGTIFKILHLIRGACGWSCLLTLSDCQVASCNAMYARLKKHDKNDSTCKYILQVPHAHRNKLAQSDAAVHNLLVVGPRVAP